MSPVDLLDIAPFQSSREHELFRGLRGREGLAFNQEPDGPGFWSLVRYADISAAAREGQLFISGQGTQIKDRRAEGHGAPSVHNSDGTLHSRLRSIVMPGLSRSVVERRTEAFARIAEELVLAAPHGEAFDFVDRIAVRLPMLVIADMLGVPPEEAPALVDSANLMSDVNASDAEQAGARQHLFDYFRDLGALKRRQPADDLATLLVEADFPEGEESQQLLDAYFMLLTIAGNETKRFLVTGGLAQLVRQGDYPLLRDHGELLPTATEEMCRFVSPVTHMRRTASADTVIAGQAIAKGDKVVLWFASGNHDEKMFREAGRLVLDRKPNPHMGFGIGPHFCLGAHLARLETRLLFEALGRHIETIELVGDPERLPSNWFTGWSAMKVRWQ